MYEDVLNESIMDLQSRLKKLRSEKKKSRSQFRYRRWGHGHAPGTQSSVNSGPVPPVIHENDHVLNDFSVDRGAVPQRGPVIHENDPVVNYLFPSTKVHGNEPITSDAPSINDRDDFDIERDESMSEELTSNDEENDITNLNWNILISKAKH